MAAPLQTFLFQYGKEMAGKKIGLIVSSASSGISGVEGDAHRLIPDGNFLTPSLWVRSSQTSNAPTLVEQWLNTIGYDSFAGIEAINSDIMWKEYNIYTLSGVKLSGGTGLAPGIYIVNGKKTMVCRK